MIALARGMVHATGAVMHAAGGETYAVIGVMHVEMAVRGSRGRRRNS